MISSTNYKGPLKILDRFFSFTNRSSSNTLIQKIFLLADALFNQFFLLLYMAFEVFYEGFSLLWSILFHYSYLFLQIESSLTSFLSEKAFLNISSNQEPLDLFLVKLISLSRSFFIELIFLAVFHDCGSVERYCFLRNI